MKIVSVNAGLPRTMEWRGRTVTTGIFKAPVPGRLAVRRHNLEGDGQADLSVHGGPDKAVYAYATGHYTWWSSVLPGVELVWGNFGENLTIEDFDEKDIRAGDVFTAGTATLEVSQPRMPCYKLGLRFGMPEMVGRFLNARRSGFYLRVLEEGFVQAGDSFLRTHTDPAAITIAEVFRLYTDKQPDPELLRRAIASPGLAIGWRDFFEARLAKRDPVAGVDDSAEPAFPQP